MDDDASLGVKSIQAPARKLQDLRDNVLRAWPFKCVPEFAYELSQGLRFVLQGVKSVIRTRWDEPGLLKGLAQQVYGLLRFHFALVHGGSQLLKKQGTALVVKLEHASVAAAIRTQKRVYLLLKAVRAVPSRHRYLDDRIAAGSCDWRDVGRRSTGERRATAQLPCVLTFGKNNGEVVALLSCLRA